MPSFRSRPASSSPASTPLPTHRIGRRRRIAWIAHRLLPRAHAVAVACLLGLGLGRATAAPPNAPVASTPTSSSYAAERDRLRAEIAHGDRDASRLATMDALRRLAEANGDQDTAQLMEVEHIFATHDDAAIDASLDALNAVRSRLRPQASPELREALARVYGNLYFDVGHFGLALKHQLDALKWADRLPTGQRQARLYRLSTISELYNAMGLPDDALRYADLGLALAADAPDASGRPVSLLGARALALMQLGRSADAARTLDEAERHNARGKPDFDTLRTASSRATLELAMSPPAKAMRAVERLQQLADQHDSPYYRTRASLLRGQARIAAGDVEDGLRDMRDAIASFEQRGQMIDVLDGLEREIQTLRAQRAWPETVTAMQHRQAIWSRLFRSEQTRAIAELEARQRADTQEQRIAALAAQVRLERAQVRAERLRMALFAALALLAACVAGLLSLSRLRTRRERDRLAHAVRHDPLTGASSRYEFLARTDAATPADSAGATILLLDLDNFKAINDEHGHAAGDAVLKTVVGRLRQAMRTDDDIYRWGGEEFLLVLAPRGEAELARDIEALRRAATAMPVAWDGRSLAVTLSGGLVRHPLATGWTATLPDAIRWADAAMYAAKHAGRDRIVQVRVTRAGVDALAGHRPIDVTQLLDWQRQGLVELQNTGPAPAAT